MKSAGCSGRDGAACPQCVCHKKRAPLTRRVALKKTFTGATYHPQFALGVMCRDEADQAGLHRQLSSTLAGREIKVLVI